jgi:hypothetical protein
MNLKEVVYEDVNLIQLAQDRAQCFNPVKTISPFNWGFYNQISDC